MVTSMSKAAPINFRHKMELAQRWLKQIEKKTCSDLENVLLDGVKCLLQESVVTLEQAKKVEEDLSFLEKKE